MVCNICVRVTPAVFSFPTVFLSVSILQQEENISNFLFYFSFLFLSSLSIILLDLSYLKNTINYIYILYFLSSTAISILSCTNESYRQPFFLNLYQSHYSNNSKSTTILKWQDLFHSINGDAFYPLNSRPSDIKCTFWQRPITDTDTFKLFLFFTGNGGSPNIIAEWILTSQYWGNGRKAEKKEPDNWICYRVTEKEKQTHGFILTFYTKTGDFKWKKRQSANN